MGPVQTRRMRSLGWIRVRMQESGIDALLEKDSSNVLYLSGFSEKDQAWLLITDSHQYLFTSVMFQGRAEQEVTVPWEVVYCGFGQKLFDLVRLKLGQTGQDKKIGYIAHSLSAGEFDEARSVFEADGWALGPVPSYGSILRLIKDEDEIAEIEKAQLMTEEIFLEIYHDLGTVRMLDKAGIRPKSFTERDIAAKVEYLMKTKGGVKAGFESIVAFGKNSSLPHAYASDTSIGDNSILQIDIGLVLFSGYNSDLSRIIFLGEISRKMEEAYRAVSKAQQVVFSMLRPGATVIEIDRASRAPIVEFLKAWGVQDTQLLEYGFLHNLGHGLGLEVHEAPSLGCKSGKQFGVGEVITIEPGVYLDGEFGIRLEDVVVITENGFRRLGNLSRGPFVV